MKIKILLAALALPAMMSLTGCVIAVGNDGDKDGYFKGHDKKIEFNNRKAIAGLVSLMSIPDVQHKLGIADFYEAFEEDNKKVQVLYYRTHIVIKDGITAKNECTALVFVDGQLTSWGDQPPTSL
ncbi:MAG: DUF3192 domain-containing protein [Thalassotalea sp.]